MINISHHSQAFKLATSMKTEILSQHEKSISISFQKQVLNKSLDFKIKRSLHLQNQRKRKVNSQKKKMKLQVNLFLQDPLRL
jgi:hypothetical protein